MDIASTISLLVGIIGTGIAIYQWAVLNESKKRKKEIQFLLAGISNLSLAKQQAWINQISLLNQPQEAEQLAHARSCVRARDDLSEIQSLVAALEGSIDSDCSATTAILEKTLEQTKLNNQIQAESLKNPTMSPRAANVAPEPEMAAEH
ncbi:hypothetical protein [Photobacterium leiognathi]|uniref:hypothetical protein n=1 Tax=Photobacterium leiognathi TaxID=553611 RepID=UPI002980AEE5|nr:hypothetical protein [Photobacterium leiognathi]